MRLVLFATNANPYLCALLKSALLHAVEVNIIGWNLRPAAGQAINQVISEMNARWACAEPRQSIVMGLDAFDTMFTPKPVSARSLRDHLAERGADFVWSAESNMFPAFSEFAPGFEESYPAGSPTRYKYLNYGGWVGTAAAACRVMQTCSQQMKNCTHCREAAQAGKTGWAWFDQHAAQYALVRLKGGARQVLDNRNEMFHSGWLDCSDFNTTSYRLRSSGVAPHVLHLNGDAKRFCGAAVFSEAWFVNRTTLPTWHITLSEGKLTRSVHVNDICPSILQPAVMAAELEGWYASTRAKAEKRMASTRHKPHRHTVKETLSAATVTCHKAPIRACAGSVMGAANGHFNCSDARVRCSAAPWCAGIHHVYPWCHAMTCLHVEDRLGHCVELVRTSARPAQRAASPWTQRGDPSCARVRLLLQGWGLGDRAELACASFQWGHATLEHLFRVDSPSPYGWYRLRALHFVRELARQPDLRNSTGAAVLITEDDATLPPVVVAALRQAGTPLLAHSIKRASKVGAILIPDWHFIEARGFQAIVAERSRRHLDKREPKLFWRGSTTGKPGALPDDGPTSPTARANTGTGCDRESPPRATSAAPPQYCVGGREALAGARSLPWTHRKAPRLGAHGQQGAGGQVGGLSRAAGCGWPRQRVGPLLAPGIGLRRVSGGVRADQRLHRADETLCALPAHRQQPVQPAAAHRPRRIREAGGYAAVGAAGESRLELESELHMEERAVVGAAASTPTFPGN